MDNYSESSAFNQMQPLSELFFVVNGGLALSSFHTILASFCPFSQKTMIFLLVPKLLKNPGMAIILFNTFNMYK